MCTKIYKFVTKTEYVNAIVCVGVYVASRLLPPLHVLQDIIASCMHCKTICEFNIYIFSHSQKTRAASQYGSRANKSSFRLLGANITDLFTLHKLTGLVPARQLVPIIKG